MRVANGATLPSSGLTVVTPDPLYVLGNYNANGPSLNNGANVANTAPAALIGDAITVLTSWSDSYSLANKTATNPNGRAATATTVNAATFEGIVPSTGNNYSGGVENFLRLLQNWSGKTLTYNGSIVVMFPVNTRPTIGFTAAITPPPTALGPSMSISCLKADSHRSPRKSGPSSGRAGPSNNPRSRTFLPLEPRGYILRDVKAAILHGRENSQMRTSRHPR